jgi:hypothetical protein
MAGMGSWRKRRASPDDLVSAAEIAAFVYCPEAWRLQFGMALTPEYRAAMDAGTHHHARKAVAERIAGGLIMFGQILVIVAAVTLLLLWWQS